MKRNEPVPFPSPALALPTSGSTSTTTSTRAVIAALCLGVLLPSLGTSIANVGLPAIALAFDATFAQVQAVVLAYLVSLTIVSVVAGRVGDLAGRRRVLLGGIAVFAASTLACATAPSLPALVAARVVQGVGAAAMMALTLALVADAVPKSRTGAAMGLLGSMSAIGTAIGPSIGGLLIDAFGWRSIFFVMLPLAALSAASVTRWLPARPASGDRAARMPLIPLDLLADPSLRGALVNSTLVSTVMMATLIVGPFYLSQALGLDATHVGFAVAAGPIVAAMAAVPAGRVVDRFGAARAAIVGLVAIGSGCLAIALTASAMSAAGIGVALYVASIVVVTAGYALFQTANNTGVMQRAGADRRGVVSGVLNLARNVGLIGGASGMGMLFAFGSGTARIGSAGAEAVATGTQVAFGASSLLMLVAILIAARRSGR